MAFLDNNLLHIARDWPAISPDAISFSHVMVGALGSRMLVLGSTCNKDSCGSLAKRAAGVMLFELRALLDTYDGHVFRVRSNQTAMVQVSGSFGYMLDGICDFLSTLFLLAALWCIIDKVTIIYYLSYKVTKPFHFPT